jgi:hypothetical protein
VEPRFEPVKLNKLVPDAYHGTDKQSIEIILKEGFKPSHGDTQYLGDGVYFFEGSKAEALTWARNRCRERNSAGPGVLRAQVNLGRCLDLNTQEGRALILQVQFEFNQRIKKTVNDATAINALATIFREKGKPLDTVRATHIGRNRKSLFEGSRFDYQSQLIICVITLTSISQIVFCE